MHCVFKNANGDEDYGDWVISDEISFCPDQFHLYYFKSYLSLSLIEYNSSNQYLVIYKLVLFGLFQLFYKRSLNTLLLFSGSFLYPSYLGFEAQSYLSH